MSLVSGGTEIVCSVRADTGGHALLLEKLPRTSRVLDVSAQSELHVHTRNAHRLLERVGALTTTQLRTLRYDSYPTPVSGARNAQRAHTPHLDQLDQALLAVLRDDARAGRAAGRDHRRTGLHHAPQGLIELTVNEFRRLFDAGLLATHHTISTLLAWSVWRRRHQARARDGPLQTPRIRPAPMITITAVVLEARTYPSHISTTKEATLSPILGHMASPLRPA